MILYVKYGENQEKEKAKNKDLILTISNYKKVKNKIESIIEKTEKINN